MIELCNQSTLAAGIFPGFSQHRAAQFTLVVKQVYEYNHQGDLHLLDACPDLVTSDVYYAQPGTSTLIQPSEIVPYKFGSEVIVTGKVYPPVAQPPVVMDATVGLQLPNGKHWSKTIMVIGERLWQSSLLGTVASDPSYIKPIDLIYEYAFGGISAMNEQKSYPQNPSGRGFDLGRQAKGSSLPQFETPGNLIRKASQSVEPAGFAAVSPLWQPRLNRIPKVDETALVAGECPFAEPCDPKWHNQAPGDQQFDTPFQDTVVLHLKALTANLDYRKTLAIKIPVAPPRVNWQTRSGKTPVALQCDTLLVNTEQQTITLLYRASITQQEIDQKQPQGKSWVMVQANTESNVPAAAPEVRYG